MKRMRTVPEHRGGRTQYASVAAPGGQSSGTQPALAIDDRRAVRRRDDPTRRREPVWPDPLDLRGLDDVTRTGAARLCGDWPLAGEDSARTRIAAHDTDIRTWMRFTTTPRSRPAPDSTLSGPALVTIFGALVALQRPPMRDPPPLRSAGRRPVRRRPGLVSAGAGPPARSRPAAGARRRRSDRSSAPASGAIRMPLPATIRATRSASTGSFDPTST